METPSYEDAIQVVKNLLDPPVSLTQLNKEYSRGMVELVADLFPVEGMYMADRKAQVARDAGIPEGMVV